MTTKKDFRATGMDPEVHDAIKAQAAARHWTQAHYMAALIGLHKTAQDYAEHDPQLRSVLVDLGLERQGL